MVLGQTQGITYRLSTGSASMLPPGSPVEGKIPQKGLLSPDPAQSAMKHFFLVPLWHFHTSYPAPRNTSQTFLRDPLSFWLCLPLFCSVPQVVLGSLPPPRPRDRRPMGCKPGLRFPRDVSCHLQGPSLNHRETRDAFGCQKMRSQAHPRCSVPVPGGCETQTFSQ